MKYDQSHLATLAKGMSTSSAMNPALLLCLMVCPLAFTFAGGLFYAEQILAALLFVIVGAWPLAITGWQLIHFTNKDPNRLQKEQHNENMLEIKSRLGLKDGDNIREIAISSQLTSNPAIEDKSGE